MHRGDKRFEYQVVFWKTDPAADDDTVISCGPQLTLYHCADGSGCVLKLYETDIDVPTSRAHLLHTKLDAGLNLLGAQPWRTARGGKVLRCRM